MTHRTHSYCAITQTQGKVGNMRNSTFSQLCCLRGACHSLVWHSKIHWQVRLTHIQPSWPKICLVSRQVVNLQRLENLTTSLCSDFWTNQSLHFQEIKNMAQYQVTVAQELKRHRSKQTFCLQTGKGRNAANGHLPVALLAPHSHWNSSLTCLTIVNWFGAPDH